MASNSDLIRAAADAAQAVAIQLHNTQYRLEAALLENHQLRRAAQGNVILLRRDGFCRVMQLEEPTYPYPYPYHHTLGFCDAPQPPVYLCRDLSPYRAVTFIWNGRRDEFGRFILEET